MLLVSNDTSLGCFEMLRAHVNLYDSRGLDYLYYNYVCNMDLS